jgi:hypothetical protein
VVRASFRVSRWGGEDGGKDIVGKSAMVVVRVQERITPIVIDLDGDTSQNLEQGV